MSRSAAVVTAGAVVLAACGNDPATIDATERDESGEVVEGGDVGVSRLRVGDCIVAPESVLAPAGDEDVISDVQTSFEVVPCDEDHTAEVVLRDDGFFDDVEEYPSDQEMFDISIDECIAGLDAYTGTDFATSPYDVFALWPDESTFDSGADRTLTCIGLTLDDDLTEYVSTSESMAAN